jgi:hypothetical protein
VDVETWLTAAQVQAMLQVGRNYPYLQLRHLAREVPGRPGSRKRLRWRQSDIVALMESSAKPARLAA